MRPRITVRLDPLPPNWYAEHPDYPHSEDAADREWRSTAHAYLATLKNGAGGEHVTPFFTGSGWTTTPSAADVLESLLLETVEPDTTFEDWCSEYGYDTDSRRALALFEHNQRQTPALAAFLGPRLFELLRNDPDGLRDMPQTIDTTTQTITTQENRTA